MSLSTHRLSQLAARGESIARRRFLIGSLVGVVLISAPALAAERASTPRVGVLLPSLANSPLEAGLRDGLREAGYTEGENLVIEWRYYSGGEQDIAAAATDLANSN